MTMEGRTRERKKKPNRTRRLSMAPETRRVSLSARNETVRRGRRGPECLEMKEENAALSASDERPTLA